MSHWAEDAVFYHIFPLGLCGAPARNDSVSPPVLRLEKLLPWMHHARKLGATALFLGPLLESESHGYDTVDFFSVDRRLGTNALLKAMVEEAHRLDMRVIMDAVFGHVGRQFPAFRDLREKGRSSPHAAWFRGVDFSRRSRLGDPFDYECWKGAMELPRLELRSPVVREHLFSAVQRWVEEFRIDGLRLDTADWLDFEFLGALRARCTGLREDFWLMGEVVHGDYRKWVSPQMLHSVTNYEVYKGLWSSHVDGNFFEIAHSLQRQFGGDGLYRGLPLYNFADNHDVDRVADSVRDPAHLFTLYCLLFTMPGVPSIYYGSEWGIEGKRTPTDDSMLRPCLDLESLLRSRPADLPDVVHRLAGLRLASMALRRGAYRQLHVASRQIVFERKWENEDVVVAVNAAPTPVALAVPSTMAAATLTDMLNGQDVIENGADDDMWHFTVPAHWARILRVQRTP